MLVVLIILALAALTLAISLVRFIKTVIEPVTFIDQRHTTAVCAQQLASWANLCGDNTSNKPNAFYASLHPTRNISIVNRNLAIDNKSFSVSRKVIITSNIDLKWYICCKRKSVLLCVRNDCLIYKLKPNPWLQTVILTTVEFVRSVITVCKAVTLLIGGDAHTTDALEVWKLTR